MAGTSDITVLYEVERATERLLQHEEFKAEIERLKLRPSDVLRRFVREPSVLAAARKEFEEFTELREGQEEHRESVPERLWPRRWRPTAAEVGWLIAMVAVPAGWFMLELVLPNRMAGTAGPWRR